MKKNPAISHQTWSESQARAALDRALTESVGSSWGSFTGEVRRLPSGAWKFGVGYPRSGRWYWTIWQDPKRPHGIALKGDRSLGGKVKRNPMKSWIVTFHPGDDLTSAEHIRRAIKRWEGKMLRVKGYVASFPNESDARQAMHMAKAYGVESSIRETLKRNPFAGPLTISHEGNALVIRHVNANPRKLNTYNVYDKSGGLAWTGRASGPEDAKNKAMRTIRIPRDRIGGAHYVPAWKLRTNSGLLPAAGGFAAGAAAMHVAHKAGLMKNPSFGVGDIVVVRIGEYRMGPSDRPPISPAREEKYKVLEISTDPGRSRRPVKLQNMKGSAGPKNAVHWAGFDEIVRVARKASRKANPASKRAGLLRTAGGFVAGAGVMHVLHKTGVMKNPKMGAHFPSVPKGFYQYAPFGIRVGNVEIHAGADYFSNGKPWWVVEIRRYDDRGAVNADGSVKWAEPMYKVKDPHKFYKFADAVKAARKADKDKPSPHTRNPASKRAKSKYASQVASGDYSGASKTLKRIHAGLKGAARRKK